MDKNRATPRIARGLFKRPESFHDGNVEAVPQVPGTYIIYKGAQPIYAGRSRVDMRKRLWCHLHNFGSRIIASEAKESLTFEFQEMMSVEQAEAELINLLGTIEFANLRRETDPADREWDVEPEGDTRNAADQ